jgi:transcription elongation factor Elf1
MSVATNLDSQATISPGFPCPRCGAQIHLDVRALLGNTPIHCTNCQLELQIDAEQSAAGLQALRKLAEQMDSAQQTLNQIKRTGRA